MDDIQLLNLQEVQVEVDGAETHRSGRTPVRIGTVFFLILAFVRSGVIVVKGYHLFRREIRHNGYEIKR